MSEDSAFSSNGEIFDHAQEQRTLWAELATATRRSGFGLCRELPSVTDPEPPGRYKCVLGLRRRSSNVQRKYNACLS